MQAPLISQSEGTVDVNLLHNRHTQMYCKKTVVTFSTMNIICHRTMKYMYLNHSLLTLYLLHLYLGV